MKAVGFDFETSSLILARRMNQSPIPPLFLDFSSMMTQSVSLPVSTTPTLVCYLSSMTLPLVRRLSSTPPHVLLCWITLSSKNIKNGSGKSQR
ncbi:hypothetical protein HA466_0014280 [Hirschfeldia incana]|nr:hypothetical protein HA466_0014280 [Hirschfeldia incana]